MATEKPVLFPKWADVFDGNQQDENGNPVENRTAPPVPLQNEGLRPNEPMPRQWLNHQFWLLGEWTQYFDENGSMGSVIWQGSKTIAEMNALDTLTLEVNWAYDMLEAGTITVGAIPVTVIVNDAVVWGAEGSFINLGQIKGLKGEDGVDGITIIIEGYKAVDDILAIPNPFIGEAWVTTDDGFLPSDHPVYPNRPVELEDTLYFATEGYWLIIPKGSGGGSAEGAVLAGGFFSANLGAYPTPYTLSDSWIWHTQDEGVIDGVLWYVGDMLSYTPHPFNPETELGTYTLVPAYPTMLESIEYLGVPSEAFATIPYVDSQNDAQDVETVDTFTGDELTGVNSYMVEEYATVVYVDDENDAQDDVTDDYVTGVQLVGE
jgi:hypothetical protein